MTIPSKTLAALPALGLAALAVVVGAAAVADGSVANPAGALPRAADASVIASEGLSPVECLRSGHHRFAIVAGRMVQLERTGDVPSEQRPRPDTSTQSAIFDRPRT